MDFSSIITHLIGKGECEDVEFKAHAGNTKDVAETICAFANKKGGYIIFGVEDKTKNILGIEKPEKSIEQIENINRNALNPMADIECEAIKYEGQTIIVAHVKSGDTLHTTQERKIYVRTGTSDSLADVSTMIRILNDRGQVHFEDFPVCRATFEDLNIEKVNNYLERIGKKGAGREPKAILSSIALLKDSIPTVAAILLFGLKPQHFFPMCYINAIKVPKKYEDCHNIMEELSKSVIINGNISDSILNGTQFVLDAPSRFEPLLVALWEAIVNAFVHRDYSIPCPVELRIWDDQIEILNPGNLAFGRTIDDIFSNPMSIARNPRIAKIMSELGFGDNICNGIHKIKTNMREGMSEAIFREDHFSFSVVLSLKREEKYEDGEQAIEQGDAADDTE